MTDALILQILLILSVGWMLGYVFSRFGLPGMLGQLVAGVILGPPILGLIHPSVPLNFIADLGIFLSCSTQGWRWTLRSSLSILGHLWPLPAVVLFFLSVLGI